MEPPPKRAKQVSFASDLSYCHSGSMSSWATSAKDDEATYFESEAVQQRSKLVSYCHSGSMSSWATSAEDDERSKSISYGQSG
eukprot:11793112-Prorocentrum_lima.AAC.1